uniref:Fibroblast growth factor 17 n=1 Tax=Nothoprocta perdicaria TaxID=30464 RepID=A0A8C6YI01_NOTPE
PGATSSLFYFIFISSLSFPLAIVCNQPSPNFNQSMREQDTASDQLSRRRIREYQLCSRTGGKHVQVTGDPAVPAATLMVETGTFVHIKGAESEQYVCMSRGKLVGKRIGRSKECIFTEVVLENNHTAFQSVRHEGWHRAWDPCVPRALDTPCPRVMLRGPRNRGCSMVPGPGAALWYPALKMLEPSQGHPQALPPCSAALAAPWTCFLHC